MKGISKLSLAVALAGYGLSAAAAVEDAGHLTLGAFEVTPELRTAIGYDDNVYRDGNIAGIKDKGSFVYNINPSVEFKAQKGLSTYALTLDVNDKRFSAESDANFTDYALLGDVHQEFNSRNRLDLGFDLGTYHDQGSTINGATDKDAPEYTRKQADIKYGFGAMEAKARFDVFASINDQDYDKKNGSYEGRSRKTTEYGTTVFYQVMPKTSALVEIKKRNLKYDSRASDNGVKAGFDITSYLVGLEWEATAKTTGYAKVGRRHRNADNKGVSSENYTGWEVGVSYMPVNHSVFQLSTSRDYGLESDNPQNADFTKGTSTTLNWMHSWTDRISTTAGYTYTDEEVQRGAGADAGKTVKDRDINTFKLGADWKLRRNLTLSLNYEHTKRDEDRKVSSVSEDGYSRNVYMLTAELAL
ncbi:outer membrane beta-barrel protein [Endozoicomonadaceae bacterium StTr2]